MLSSTKPPRIADPWNDIDYQFGSPEIEIMCRFDLHEDGDWTQAIRAAVVALENGLPVPDWAKPEMSAVLKQEIGLQPRRRKRGRDARGHSWADLMNQISVVAPVDAAAELGFKGKGKFKVATETLNREGVPSGSLGSTNARFKKHREIHRTHPNYPILREVFRDAIREAERFPTP